MSDNALVKTERLFDVDSIITSFIIGDLQEDQLVDYRKGVVSDKASKIMESINQEAKTKVADFLSSSEYLSINQLAESGLPDKLVAAVPLLAKSVQSYVNGSIESGELVKTLSSSGKNIANEVMKAYGIDSKFYTEAFQQIQNLSPSIVAFVCFTEVYKISMSVMDDAEMAYENRLKVEQECAASIENIRHYREQMEDIVSQYLSDKIERFEAGFSAMDEAILNNDTEGYIKGNATIQEALGYKPRFTNQEEFDDLMLSDEAFKF